jgi:DNA/RNA-binding domain of Phe-tRNA-synthetase-like protein
MVELKIDESAREKWSGEAVLTTFMMEGLSESADLKQELDREIALMQSELRTIGKDILNDSIVLRMRTTFRAMPDMDPARYRPASEALIRRCLDKGLFRITPLVDVNNLLSIRLRIPLGIYALDRIHSTAWTYRIGNPGETYLTISQQQKNADGKLVVADSEGVIGSPVADSGRGAIDNKANKVLVIGYLPVDTNKTEAEKWVAEVRNTFIRFFAPTTSNSRVVML